MSTMARWLLQVTSDHLGQTKVRLPGHNAINRMSNQTIDIAHVKVDE